MSGKIEVGCWAIVYKAYPCCGHRAIAFGLPFIVQNIRHDVRIQCANCRKTYQMSHVNSRIGDIWNGYPLQCLKRIDPPADSTTIERETEREGT